MPLEIDLRKNKVIGPMIEEALQEGRQEGRQEGLQKGLQKGELTVLRRQIQKRFGRLPGWAEEQLAARSAAELEDLSERVLDAVSLEDLLER